MEEMNGWVYQALRAMGLSAKGADAWDQWILLLLILIVAFVADFVCRVLLLRVVKRVVATTRAKWDDILFEDRVLHRLCHIVPPVLIYFMLPYAFPEAPEAISLWLKVILVYIIAVVLRFVNAFLQALYDVANAKEELQGKPLKGLMQTGQIIALCIGLILIVSILIDKSPARLLAGLGASAAVLMLVFKDSIMGLVSGVQLSANNMLHVGDWISVEKHGVNGRVVEVTLLTADGQQHTVNFEPDDVGDFRISRFKRAVMVSRLPRSVGKLENSQVIIEVKKTDGELLFRNIFAVER